LRLGPAVRPGQGTRATRARALAQERLEREKEARQQAAANFRKAREAVDRSFTLVSESDLFDATGLQPLRKQLLESALEYYREFADQQPEDPNLQAELAAAYFRIWQIYRSLDQHPEALAALQKALDIGEKLRREYAVKSEAVGTLAKIRYGGLRYGVGSMYTSLSVYDSQGSLRLLQRAADFWAGLAAEYPQLPDFQRNLAEAYDEIANLEDNPSEQVRTAEKAFATWEKLGQDHPQMVAGGREEAYRKAFLG